MDIQEPISQRSINRASFLAITLFLWGLFYFGLSTPFITILFAYLVIMHVGKVFPKPWAIVIFGIISVVLFYLFIHSLQQAVGALPSTAEKAIPMIVDYANKKGFDIPFSDSVTLKSYIVDEVRSQLLHLAKFAQLFTKEFLYIIIGLVVTCGVFARGEIDLERDSHGMKHNLYSDFTSAIAERFRRFFRSFHTVMGAQVIISAVNTFFTGLFLLILSLLGMPLPYSFVIVVITFVCGLLPIIGNLISNTVIFFIGLSQSVQLGIVAITYLIILHKFEYFLNSKIIGGRIKNPMWLTLVGLLLGERLGGVPGMILAPVILHYCKLEARHIPTNPHKQAL